MKKLLMCLIPLTGLVMVVATSTRKVRLTLAVALHEVIRRQASVLVREDVVSEAPNESRQDRLSCIRKSF